MTDKQTAVPEANGTATRGRKAPTPVAEAPVPPGALQAPAPAPAPETTDQNEMVSTKRRMPDNLRRFLLKVQGGKYYLPAAYRLVWFRDECPDWGIVTELIEGGQEAGFATVQARIFNPEGRLIATGIKTETKQDFPAGWVEKAETGACARALSMAGYGTQFMPELDDDGYRPADSPLPYRPSAASAASEAPRRMDAPGPVFTGESGARPVSEIWEGPGQCPRCHAPEGKRHGKPCVA